MERGCCVSKRQGPEESRRPPGRERLPRWTAHRREDSSNGQKGEQDFREEDQIVVTEERG